MKSATIIYGNLGLEWSEAGDVRITRQDNAQAICLSRTEFLLIIKAAALFDWPVAPPQDLTGIPIL